MRPAKFLKDVGSLSALRSIWSRWRWWRNWRRFFRQLFEGFADSAVKRSLDFGDGGLGDFFSHSFGGATGGAGNGRSRGREASVILL